jgi:hypothetical protein
MRTRSGEGCRQRKLGIKQRPQLWYPYKEPIFFLITYLTRCAVRIHITSISTHINILILFPRPQIVSNPETLDLSAVPHMSRTAIQPLQDGAGTRRGFLTASL